MSPFSDPLLPKSVLLRKRQVKNNSPAEGDEHQHCDDHAQKPAEVGQWSAGWVHRTVSHFVEVGVSNPPSNRCTQRKDEPEDAEHENKTIAMWPHLVYLAQRAFGAELQELLRQAEA